MIVREKLKEPLSEPFVKVAVDIRRGVLACGGEFHVDCAEELVRDGSAPKDIWGANALQNPWRIEFTSFINIRPVDNNRSMEISIPEVRGKVEKIMKTLLFA